MRLVYSGTHKSSHILIFFLSTVLSHWVLSHWDFSHRKLGLLYPGKASSRQRCATQHMMHAGCLSVSKIHLNSDINYRIFNVHTDVNAFNCKWGCTAVTCKRVCTESWLWEKDHLPHWGIEPASVACRPDALATGLHPHSKNVGPRSDRKMSFFLFFFF